MERTTKSVDEHLAGIEGQMGEDMSLLDQEIASRMDGRGRFLYEGRFWGGTDQQIIGYGVMDHQDRSGKDVRWFVIGLAAQKKYISIYVNAVENGAYLLGQYKGRLGKVKMGSAAISFGDLGDVELEALWELVTRAGELTA